MKQISRLARDRVLFFNCDIQQIFSNPKNMYNPQQVIECACLMNEVAGVLDIPVVVSQQNTKVFGETVQQVKDTLPMKHHLYEKITFTMFNEDGKAILSKYPERKTVVIYGIEAHVCVQQTCLDLLQNGYAVHLLTDGTSSNRELYRSTVYQKLQQYGVVLDTSQSVIFELLGNYKDDKFKPILQLIKKYQFEGIFTKL